MLLTLLPLALFAQFPGGTANDFCAHLATHTKQNVVVVKTTSGNLSAFNYDPADLDNINRTLRSKAKLELVVGSDVIVNDGRVPMVRLCTETQEKVQTPKWVLPEVQEGSITFGTEENEAINPAELADTKFSKPLKVHWFYDQVPTYVHVEKVSERSFLTYIAKGIGARFVDTPKEFRLDFDPSAMRNRIVKTIGVFKELWLQQTKEIEDNAVADPAGRPDFAVAVLQDMSHGELTQAFATPESKVEVRLTQGNAAYKQGASMLDNYVTNSSKGREIVRTPTGEFALPLRADSRRPVVATLSAKFSTAFKLTIIDANGKSMGEMSLGFGSLEY